MTRICLTCGKEFSPLSNLDVSKNCGAECKAIYRGMYGHGHRVVAIVLPSKQCEICGKEFIPRCHTTVSCGRKCATVRRKKEVKRWQADHVGERQQRDYNRQSKLKRINNTSSGTYAGMSIVSRDWFRAGFDDYRLIHPLMVPSND